MYEKKEESLNQRIMILNLKKMLKSFVKNIRYKNKTKSLKS